MQKTLKDEAEVYEPTTMRNIVEIEQLTVDAPVKEETFKQGTEDEFTVKYIEYNNEKYRVPNSVLKSLKALLEDNPEFRRFRVIKTGEGLKTEYTVVPLP